jgi:uncharacterized protein YndB with AHSA1/START domain
MPAERGQATITIDAPPERVYELITDLSRMGEWSPETVRASWLRGATGPAPGARFRGWNRRGWQRWPTDPVVETAETGRELTFVTTMFGLGRFTRWSYQLAPTGEGTEVTESWEQVRRIPGFTRFFLSDARVTELQAGMEETLRRIKAAAER